MPVPVIFSTFPGGSSIPLADLDLNFAYLTASPAFTGNISVAGNISATGSLSVTGASSFAGPVTMTSGLSLTGPFTINGQTVTPTGTTGTGLLVFNNAPTLISPILGTPASGNLSLCTGYPITQIAGLAAGVLPFLTNPSSATLAQAVVDETGTGSLVFSNAPSLSGPIMTSPVLGTPVSGNLTACTNYPATALVGVTPVANGGTGLATTGAVGDVLAVSAPGVLSYVSAPPAASVAGGVASQILYQSAPNVTSFIANGTLGQVLNSNGALAPSWGSVNASTSISGILPTANGGTGLSALGTGVASALSNPIDTVGGLVSYPGGAPAGAVMFFAMSTAPTGWLIANGAAVSRATYATLFAAIGTLYGPGDGSTTFNLPNLNGQFIRGWDSSGSVDPGRTFGSTQTDAYLNHNHGITDPGHQHTYPGSSSLSSGGAPILGPTVTTTATNSAFTGITVNTSTTGGTETRPKNVALLPCIKF